MEQEKITRIWSLEFLIKLDFALKAGPNTSLGIKPTCNGKYTCRDRQQFTLYMQGTSNFSVV